MLQKFTNHINNKLPFLKDKKLLIAISGGVDSVVLTHLLSKLNFNISLAHCNFHLREKESNLDEDFVIKLGEKLNLNTTIVAEKLVDEVINYNGIYKAVSAKTLQTTTFTNGILNSLQNGYNQKFSGDVLLVPNPSTISHPKKGTTHGSGYSYDTHIPMIFYGNGIKKGASKRKYEIIDIAPTLSNLLQIEFPNGSTGKIIEEVLK